jgi:hypothetical protein
VIVAEFHVAPTTREGNNNSEYPIEKPLTRDGRKQNDSFTFEITREDQSFWAIAISQLSHS